jgi:radical SAM protein with 4Fe4S-binding SPASM domain
MNPPILTTAARIEDQPDVIPDPGRANVVAAVVARSQSPDVPRQLLPGRSLIPIQGKSVLEWIVSRLQRSRRLRKIIVATTADPADREIIDEAARLGVQWCVGSADFVLERLLEAAENEGADHIVRVNGNFPLVDVAAMDGLIGLHLNNRADFSYNSHFHGLAYGMGVEVFSRFSLEKLRDMDLTVEQKLIGGLFMNQNPDEFRILAAPSDIPAPRLRVSVDYQPDLDLVSAILDLDPEADHARVVEFLDKKPELVESQQIATAEEVGLEKILLFPDKVASMKRNNCVTVDETYPISVELSLTNRCNLKCVWCSDADLRDRLDGEMDQKTLLQLLIDLRTGGTRGITIEGGGEPTLHKNFLDVVDAARGLDLHLGLISNGFLIPYAHRVRDFDWIRISLDAATPEQYLQAKGVNGFRRVVDNLMKLANDKNGTTLGVGYVVSNLNDDPVELEKLVRMLRKIRVSYIHFRPVVDHPEMDSTVDLSFLKKYETEDFAVMISAMEENSVMGNAGLPCLAHSLSSVITAEGSVFICGRLNIFETWEPIGNLQRQSFRSVWRSDKRRDQVRQINDPEFCRAHCPRCRMTKYNVLLDKMGRMRTRNFI